MNRAAMVPSEMMHCTDMMTVLERQKARLKWLQQQEERLQQQEEQLQQQVQQESYFGDLGGGVFLMTQNNEFAGGGLGDVVTRSVKPDPALVDKVWTSTAHDMVVPGFGPCGHGESTGSGVDMNYAISRTSSCPPMAAAAAAAAAARNKECVESESKMSSGIVRESFKKRKADKVVAEEKTRDKRIQGCAGEGESKITGRTNNKSSGCNKINSSSNNKTTKSNKDNSAETSKDNSKVTDAQKTDYIHVRARRGQATDSHSLAERVRREKISERMKYLQDLVPGCNKITGKAGMLDEIINYVQSLQRQVEFLSMKLAAVNPRLDFNIDSLFSKEDFSACGTNFPTTGLSSDMTNPAYLQLNPVQQQLVTCCGLDMGVANPPEMGVRRTISSPISDTFLDSSCFNFMLALQQIQPPPTWGADLQNLYNVAFDQGRSTSFPHQAFAGSIGDSNLKMEI